MIQQAWTIATPLPCSLRYSLGAELYPAFLFSAWSFFFWCLLRAGLPAAGLAGLFGAGELAAEEAPACLAFLAAEEVALGES